MTKNFAIVIACLWFFAVGYGTAELKFENNCNLTYPNNVAGCAQLSGTIFGWPWNRR